jgi:DNA-binding MarR family transcriptional regulator
MGTFNKLAFVKYFVVNLPRINQFKMINVIQSVRKFNRFYVNLFGLLQNSLFDFDYSLTESRIIFEIDAERVLNARKLKDMLFIDEGYLSRIINRLVRDEIIKKEQSETDKRIHNLSLTEKGIELLHKINAKADIQMGNILQKLTPEEQFRIGEIVTELKDLFEKAIKNSDEIINI